MPDRMHDTLTTLRADTERVVLADSAAVRRRGTQRTRRKAAASVLAGAAVVTAIIGLGTGVPGTDRATQQLPASPSPTATVQAPLTLDVLLPVADLPAESVYTWTTGETLDPATAGNATSRGLTVCGAPPTGGVPPRRALLRTYPSDLDGLMWEWVAEYRTADEAARARAAISGRCEAAGATITPGTLPGDASGFVASRFSADPDSEFNGEVHGVSTRGNVLVVLGLRGQLRERDVDLGAFQSASARAVDRLPAG